MSDWKRMTEGISGTIELTEDSSQELLRILEEQDAEFINELLEGKRDLTIRGSDGRSVDLTPKSKEGEWSLTLNYDYRCTACGLITSSYKANYCPNCGAKMKGEAE